MAFVTAVPGMASACLPAWADNGASPGDVTIEVKAGYGGLAVSRLGAWVPFRILVTNDGPPIAGRLVVFAEAPSNHQSREFSEDVQLPTGSRKLYEIEAYLNSTQLDPVVRVIQHSSSGDKVVAETPVKVEQESAVPGDLVEIAVVDSDDTALSNINSIPLDLTHMAFTQVLSTGSGTNVATQPPASGANVAVQPAGSGANVAVQPAGAGSHQYASHQGPGPGSGFSMYGPRLLKARPVVISPTDLPRGFGSYDPLDALVLGGAPLSQLDLDQGKALRLWVAAGGLLIVTGGADFSGLRPAGLDVLMPADVLNTETISAIPEVTDLYGAFDSTDPIVVTRARLRPGAKVLVGTVDRPMIIERGFGKGLVRYIAIDPKHNPFRSWKGSANLWQDMLLPGAQFRQKRFSLASFGSQMSSTLYDMAQVKPPSAGNLLLFLVVYLIVVGPLNYLGLRWARKLDLAWVTIPVVVIVFTGFSIVAAQTSRGSDLVGASVSAIEFYQQDGLARITGDLLLVPPSKSIHEVTFDSGAFVNDASMMVEADAITTTYHPNNTSVAIPADKWAPISFRVRQMTEGQRPIISVEGADSSTKSGYIRVKNLASFAITRAVVLTRGGITGLFDIGPGEERECELQAPAAQTFSAWYSSQLATGSSDAQVLSYLAPSFPYGGGSVMGGDLFGNTPIANLITQMDRPVLVGLGNNDEPRFGYKLAVKRIARQMFVVHL